MAAQVQTLYNDSSLLYDELHKLYPEVAESDIVTLMRENGYDKGKCLAALVQKSNQALYGPEPVTMTTVADRFADLHLPPPATRHQFSDTTRHQISVPQLTPTSRDMPYFTAQQTHYVQRPPAVSVSQKPQFSPCFPPPKPREQTSSGQVPRYVTQIDVEAQNCDRVVGQGGGYMSPSYNPSSLPHFAGLPGTCAIERQPASLQIHSNNTPAASTHHGILVERPGQFSQPFPQGGVPHRGGGDHHRQLYTPPSGVESYPTSQQRFVRQSPSALQHPSPLSQTPPTPSSSRYLTTTFIKVSPGEHSRVPFYQPPRGPPVATPPTYPWQSPSYNRSSPTDLLTSPDPDIARIRQQPLQPLVSPARPSLLQPVGIGPVPWPRSEVPASEDAYMQTLLQYQAQRRHKLEQDMVESRRLLEQLRAEVTSMEQEQLTRRRRSRNYTFPQAHHVQSIRETNRKLQIDIKIMAAQVDMVTNGQTPLGILDPQEQQRFYSNINPGQQVPINQSVSPHLHPATQHSLRSVSPPPPYVPSHVNPMPPHGPPDDMAQWSCSACTFLNHPQLDKCEVCEMPRISVGFT